MILRDMSVILIISIVLLSASIGWVSSKFLGDDNVVEEDMEDVIKEETGLKLDLTPSSTEKK